MAFLSRLKRTRKPASDVFSEMELDGECAPELAQTARSDLARLFYARHGQNGRLIHKWTHFLDAYDRHFSPYRGTDVTMLEIGVSQGGSLELWRDYFGPAATITGIDVDPECAARVTPPNRVRIGSQDDPDFLRAVVNETGAPDIILDDGSHIARHQSASFEILFPLLRNGGLYVIEDLHTAYWDNYWEGGYRKAGTAIELVKQMIDDLHAWYHDRPDATGAKDWIPAIHIYDSIVVLEKQERQAPRHIQVR